MRVLQLRFLIIVSLKDEWVSYFCFSIKNDRTHPTLLLLILIEYSLETSKKIKVDVVLGQNFGKTKLNVVKKSKETGILSIGFFHILHGEYLLKEKVVIVQTPGWKCKVNISRNMPHLKDVKAKCL